MFRHQLILSIALVLACLSAFAPGQFLQPGRTPFTLLGPSGPTGSTVAFVDLGPQALIALGDVDAVHVFESNGATQAWTQITGNAGSSFGDALNADGDANGDGVADLIIGAPQEGRVYVYDGSTLAPPGASPTLLLSLSGSVSGRFGSSVAFIGDVDGDGKDDFSVGEPRHDLPGAQDAGRVQVHSGADGSMLYEIVRNDLGASISADSSDRVVFDRLADDLVQRLTRDCADVEALLAMRPRLLAVDLDQPPYDFAPFDSMWDRVMRTDAVRQTPPI